MYLTGQENQKEHTQYPLKTVALLVLTPVTYLSVTSEASEAVQIAAIGKELNKQLNIQGFSINFRKYNRVQCLY